MDRSEGFQRPLLEVEYGYCTAVFHISHIFSFFMSTITKIKRSKTSLQLSKGVTNLDPWRCLSNGQVFHCLFDENDTMFTIFDVLRNKEERTAWWAPFLFSWGKRLPIRNFYKKNVENFRVLDCVNTGECWGCLSAVRLFILFMLSRKWEILQQQ